VSGIREVKLAPNATKGAKIALVPVDFVSRSIASVGLLDRSLGRSISVHYGFSTAFNDLFRWAQKFETGIKFVHFSVWWDFLQEEIEKAKENPKRLERISNLLLFEGGFPNENSQGSYLLKSFLDDDNHLPLGDEEFEIFAKRYWTK
jgi:hypothetical protein